MQGVLFEVLSWAGGLYTERCREIEKWVENGGREEGGWLEGGNRDSRHWSY